MDTLLNRRTIRSYTSQTVAPELLNELLAATIRSSTTGNMQLYSIVVTREEATRKALAPAHFNQPVSLNAPLLVTFCADFNRFNLWCEQRQAVPGYANFQSFMTAALDATIAAQTFCIAAEAKGLGICYLGTTTYNPDKIIEVLNLPRFVVPITTIALGYPAQIPEACERLPLEAVVHYEAYQPYTPESIDRLYAEKEAYAPNVQFTRENNKETLAQVFTDIRYPQANNEHFSHVLLEVLKGQGFLNSETL
jgi:nitroreductase